MATMANTAETAGKETAGQTSADRPAKRVVLLGASNLAKALSTVIDTSRLIWGSPIDVLAALGHGRSYGLSSTIVGRTLPGISVCGLWKALDARPPSPLAALLTDIGNDLLYEAPVEQIAGWVEQCLDRLLSHNARIVMTLLPVENIIALSQWRFYIARTVLFPNSRLQLKVIAERALELNDRVRQLGTARNVYLAEHQTAWYGFDPIHIRMRHWSSAWPTILASWMEANTSPAVPRRSLSRWLYLRSRMPERVKVFGIPLSGAQPAGRLPDGTTVSLY